MVRARLMIDNETVCLYNFYCSEIPQSFVWLAFMRYKRDFDVNAVTSTKTTTIHYGKTNVFVNDGDHSRLTT